MVIFRRGTVVAGGERPGSCHRASNNGQVVPDLSSSQGQGERAPVSRRRMQSQADRVFAPVVRSEMAAMSALPRSRRYLYVDDLRTASSPLTSTFSCRRFWLLCPGYAQSR